MKINLIELHGQVVNKVSPRSSIAPDSEAAHTADAFSQQQQSQSQANQSTQSSSQQQSKPEPGKAPSRAGACRVCLKSFKPDDFSKICFECQQKVCEDCASYSKLEEHEDAVRSSDCHSIITPTSVYDIRNCSRPEQLTWRCSVCRRKMASRVCIPQDSTDSMLDVPIIEALQRRHSDVKLGSSQQLSTGNGLGLAPPRSPELRRHSDVSPATIKELEKVNCQNVLACMYHLSTSTFCIFICSRNT